MKNEKFEIIKESLAKTYQAIADNKNIEINFAENETINFFQFDEKIIANKSLNISSEIFKNENLGKNFFKIRSIYDLAISYVLYNDEKILLNFFSENNFTESEILTIKSLEKIRIINSLKDQYLGSFANIVSKIQIELDDCKIKLDMILLDKILAKKSWSKKFTKIADFALNFSNDFDQKIISQIDELIDISDQKEFLTKVLKVINLIRQDQQKEIAKQQKNQSKESAKNNQLKDNSEQKEGYQESQNSENVDQKIDYQQHQQQSDFEEQNQLENEIEKKAQEEQKINSSSDEEANSQLRSNFQENSYNKNDKIIFTEGYKIYTTKFDQIVYPSRLVDKDELKKLRNQFDLKIEKLSKISKKMTILLKKKILSKRIISDNYDFSGAVLNKKKLVPLILDAKTEDIWLNHKEYSFQNTALTILLDNSGSMRGQPIMMSAMASEIIASMLEKFMIKTEIIGFTTADWKGGKAKKMWESNGRIKNPGRLNEVRHIIYKHFNQNLKQAKNNLALMLKEGVLKENIDGEAILFAKSRLLQRKEKRKILMVISDGNPVDDSTSSTNDRDILTNHLHQVIAKIENNSRTNQKIEIVGIGIGHSTNEFYKNSISIKSIEELGDVMIEKIVSLL